MSPKEPEGLDFEMEEPASLIAEKDEAAKKAMRRSFRVPIGDEDGLTVRRGGVILRVFNISTGGIGLLLEDPEGCRRRDSLIHLTLEIESKAWDVVTRVAHLSPFESGGYLCGLEFKQMDAEMVKVLDDFVLRARKKWLAAD